MCVETKFLLLILFGGSKHEDDYPLASAIKLCELKGQPLLFLGVFGKNGKTHSLTVFRDKIEVWKEA